ncbi:MAG: hypothetical protein KatS3mg052_2543 [Candidatus Roseilinea sp.]|nr:MAG: hypothetical protein KatS3mg052_2543 [Candidatus Roseilinea sp.]
MTSRLYVGNLAYSTTDEGLRNFFAAAGEVKSAEIVLERGSRRSKGFGFVEMATDEGAQNAINTLNGKLLDQRPIRIDFARPKEERPRNMSSNAPERTSRLGGSSGNRGNRDRRDAARGRDRERNRDWRRDAYDDF